MKPRTRGSEREEEVKRERERERGKRQCQSKQYLVIATLDSTPGARRWNDGTRGAAAGWLRTVKSDVYSLLVIALLCFLFFSFFLSFLFSLFHLLVNNEQGW